jgi:hypothetical protein
MAIMVFGLIAVAITPMITSGVNAYFRVRDVTDVNARAELAMDRMAREIRDIDPATITSYSSSQLSFTSSGNTVTYSVASNTLSRTLSGTADHLATNVTSLTFTYYQDDWTTPTAASQIWSIRFVLAVAGTYTTESLRTTVFLRGGNKSR